MPHHHMYIEVDGKPVPVDTLEGAAWLEEHTEDRIVGNDEVDGVHVSTCFIAINHQFHPDGPPLVYETLVRGDDDMYIRRYSTREEARVGHNRVLNKLRMKESLYD